MTSKGEIDFDLSQSQGISQIAGNCESARMNFLPRGRTLGVPKASPNRDAALGLIAHWTSAEMQLFQATGAGYLPMRGSIATSPAMAKSPHIGWTLEYAAQNPLKFNWPDHPYFLNATLARAVEQVVSNKTGIRRGTGGCRESLPRRRKTLICWPL